jgi:hypothetical protein
MIRKRNPPLVSEFRMVSILYDEALDLVAMDTEAYYNDPTDESLVITLPGMVPTWWHLRVYSMDEERDLDVWTAQRVDLEEDNIDAARGRLKSARAFDLCLVAVENFDEEGDLIRPEAESWRLKLVARAREELRNPLLFVELGSLLRRVARGTAVSEPEGVDEKKSS